MRRLPCLLVPLVLIVPILAGCGDDDAVGSPPEGTTEGDGAPADGDAPVEGNESIDGAAGADEPAAPAPELEVDEAEGIDDPGVLLADLDGEQVASDAGDEGATGRFEAELVAGSLCVDMAVDGAEGAPDGATLQEDDDETLLDLGGPTGADGDRATWDDVCVPVPDELVTRVATEPGRFQVVVRSTAFPDGAVGGTLALGSIFDRELA